MIAFILAELTHWKNDCSRRTLKILLYICAAAGISCLMRPDICIPVLMAVFIWIGMVTCQHEESDFDIKNWIREARLSPWQLIVAKIFITIIVALFHLIVLLPVAILVNSIWGIAWNIIGFICLALLITTIIAAIFEILLTRSYWIEPFVRILLVFMWFSTISAIPQLRVMSPFIWIWRVTVQGINRNTLLSLILNLGFMLSLTVITRVTLKKEMWKNNEN